MDRVENIIYEFSGEKFINWDTNIFENRNISNKIWIQIFLQFKDIFNMDLDDLMDAVNLFSINNINNYIYSKMV